MNEKLRYGLLNFSLIIVGFIIFFILIEIGLALNFHFLGYEGSQNIEKGKSIYYPEIGLMTYSNRIVEHINPEYSVVAKTNSIGFRDREHTIEKNSNVFRIVVLGDSFTEALQVPIEQSFPYLLENKLNSHPNIQKEIEILNFGLSGFGTDREYLTLKYIGLEYNPDLVILVFFRNDVRNNYAEFENLYCHVFQSGNISSNAHPFFIINNSGELEELPFQPNFINLEHDNQSNKINFLKDFLRKFRSFRYLNSKVKNIQRQKDSIGYEMNGVPIDYYIYANNYSDNWYDAWNITEALILKINEESKENGAQFLIVSVPDRIQLHKEYWQETLMTYPNMRNMDWDLEKSEIILTNFSTRNNITYLPLLYPFEEYVNQTNEKVHGHYDAHFNAKGQKLTSEFIYEKLIEEELIPLGDED